jgi:hypothetical protein
MLSRQSNQAWCSKLACVAGGVMVAVIAVGLVLRGVIAGGGMDVGFVVGDER